MSTTALPRTACTPRTAVLWSSPATSHRPSWIERLAAWADRQPRHHHLGRWTAV